MNATPLPTPDLTPKPSFVARTLTSLGPAMGLVFVFALFAGLRPATFLTASNMQLMLLQTSVVAMGALGMTMVIIIGGIDLSIGATIALTTVVVASALRSFTDVHQNVEGVVTSVMADNAGPATALVAAGVGVFAGALVGALIGLLVTRGRMMPFIVTLGMWSSYRGAAESFAHEKTVNAPESWLSLLMVQPKGAMKWTLLAPAVWITLAFAGLVAFGLRYTRFGRHVFAIGSNEQTARLCGVPVGRVKFMVYVLGGVFAGLAGVLQFSYLTVGDPTTASGIELSIIAAVVIGGASLLGGRGSILGTLMGAMIMTVVANGCQKVGMWNSTQKIVTGAIIILAVWLDQFRDRTK